jgi:hypothetical protein
MDDVVAMDGRVIVAKRRARQLAALSARKVMKRDPRPPVLYLRCFGDDQLRLRAATLGGRRSFIERLSPSRFDSFEEVLTRHLTEYGPVVAVNPPGTQLAPVGAARETLPHDSWQATVREWMERAALMVIGAPPGFWTPGLVWELEQIDTYNLWPKTIVVSPHWLMTNCVGDGSHSPPQARRTVRSDKDCRRTPRSSSPSREGVKGLSHTPPTPEPSGATPWRLLRQPPSLAEASAPTLAAVHGGSPVGGYFMNSRLDRMDWASVESSSAKIPRIQHADLGSSDATQRHIASLSPSSATESITNSPGKRVSSLRMRCQFRNSS